MFDESVVAKAASDALDAVAVLADSVRAGLSPEDVAVAVHACETLRRQLAGLDNHVLSQVAEQVATGGLPARSTADCLVQAVRLSGKEAAARVRAAVDCGPKRALTGELLSPTFPLVAAAQDVGVISFEHARIIRTALAKLPAAVAAEHGAHAEQVLVERAREFPPPMLERIAQRLILTLDPDGARPSEAEQQRSRCLSRRSNADGSSDWRLHATPELTAKADAVLGALSGPKVGEDGLRDARSRGQREHDAMLDVLDRILCSDTLPQTGGLPVTVSITLPAKEWEAAVAGDESVTAITGYGQDLPGAVLMRLAEQARRLFIPLSRWGTPLDVGYDERLCTPDQRRALNVRDRGCTFPGCPMPAAWCQAHHVIAWSDIAARQLYETGERPSKKRSREQGQGGTHLNNLALLCAVHHRLFELWGWVLIMKHGQPWWIPPTTHDPDQRPIQNTAHHPDLHFDYTPQAAGGGADPPGPGG